MATTQINLFGEVELVKNKSKSPKQVLKAELNKWLKTEGLIRFKELYDGIDNGQYIKLPKGIDRATWLNVAFEVWRENQLKNTK
jgi:hypothetical protein